MRWQLQEAKAKLSELVKRAETEGPQEITVHGEIKAVVLSQTEYERLIGKPETFWEVMRRSPLVGVELDLERDPDDTERPVDV